MGIVVNGVEITDAAIEAVLPRFGGEQGGLKLAVEQVILKELLRQRADSLGLAGADENARIEGLIAREVISPEVTDVVCRQWYEQHPDQFMEGELVEVRHILFQVTPSVDLEALRTRAEEILGLLREGTLEFTEVAREFSNCPSGAVGGNLGQISRGQTVPEFEKVAFRLPEGEVCPYLVESRFGLHVMRVDRHVAGRLLPYEMVAESLSGWLSESSERKALLQYLKQLVGQAHIEGFDMEGAGSPLVQ